MNNALLRRIQMKVDIENGRAFRHGADIFANNCLKNGVLTVVLRPSEIAQLLARDAAGLYWLKIDLEQCQVSWNGGFQAHFEIDPFSRTCLLEGLDEIGTTLKREAEIARYERTRQAGL